VQEIMPPVSNIGTWWICWWTLVLLPNSCFEPRFDSNNTNSIIPIPRLLHYQLIFQSSTNHVQNQIICNNDCNTRILTLLDMDDDVGTSTHASSYFSFNL
jgi:hypothetical protein